MAAALAAVLAGCSVSAGPGAAGSGSPSATARGTAGVPVVLQFGDRVATATLTDTPEARQFAAMLPVTVDLKDVWSGEVRRAAAGAHGRRHHRDP
jgi:hypothetical protein